MKVRLFGSLGDEVALTALPREIHRWHPRERVVVECSRPWLFDGNDEMTRGDEDRLGSRTLTWDPVPDVGPFPVAYGIALNIPVVDSTPILVPSQHDRDIAGRLVSDAARSGAGPIVAFDTWAGWPRRRWARWRQLLDSMPEVQWIEVGATVPDFRGIEAGRSDGRLRCGRQAERDGNRGADCACGSVRRRRLRTRTRRGGRSHTCGCVVCHPLVDARVSIDVARVSPRAHHLPLRGNVQARSEADGPDQRRHGPPDDH